MASFIAEPLSRKRIRAFTKYIRDLCGLQKILYFPVVEFLENMLPELVEDFNFEILEFSEMGDKEGETIPSCNSINIREDVYEKAVNGDGRARFTILHEIGHLLLHDNDRVALCRTSDRSSVRTFENPEWQADVFAGELLMCKDLIKDMSVAEIEIYCGASHAAAECQYNQIRR